MHRILITLFAALFLVGCNSASVPKDVVASNSSASDYGPPEVVGKIESSEIKESSGLAVSQCQPNVMWTHNDGDDAVIFAMSLEGKHFGAWSVPNARNTDWEDIAIRKDASGKCFLFVGDIGNNDGDRTELTIFRIPEPVVKPELAAVEGKTANESEPAQALRFSYPDAAPNAESLIVPPSTDDIYIVSKQNKGPGTVYKLRAAFGAEPQKAEKISELSVNEKPPGRFTGGTVSPDGRRVMLCDNENGYEFVIPEGGDLSSIWKQQPKVVDLGKRKQGEGISYSADGRSVYASSEGKDAAIVRVTRR